MKLRLGIVLGLVAALFAACRKDLNDSEIPVAEIIAPQGQTYIDSIPLQLNFADDKNLLQYRVSIVYAGVVDPLDTNAVVDPLSVVYINEISGSTAQKLLKIAIPDTALSGYYRVLLTCVDEAGLEAKTDTGSFNLINLADTTKPVLSNISPAAGSTYLTTDSIIVNALAIDQHNITFYSVKLTDSTGTQKAIVQEYINVNSFAIDGVLRWTNLPVGNYAIYFTCRDAYYNTQTIIIPIYIN